MAAHFIEAGGHYDNQLLSSWPHLRQRVFSRDVEFHQDCAYELPGTHQADANKLFGACFGLRGAHRNSARFGWYYDPEDQKIVLLAYCYVRGVRNATAQLEYPVVARIGLGERVKCSIRVTDTGYVFECRQGDENRGQMVNVPHAGVPLLGWTLGSYFGGDCRAPHLMHFWLD